MGVDTNYQQSADAAELWASWRDQAACIGQPALMDPPVGDLPAEWAATDLCRGCPALTDCRTWVMSLLERHDPGGVCGGMTERERTHARKVIVGQRARATQLAREAA
jgi:hypothetical protein